MLVMYMLHASNSHTATIDGIVCVVWLLDACSIYIISILYQTCHLTRAKRVRPTSEFQTRLTRTVDENPLEIINLQL